MKSFDYARARALDDAADCLGQSGAKAIAGGTNLIDLMKLQVETPSTLCDISRLGLAGIHDTDDGGLAIGALATNTQTAVNDRVRGDYPLLARAILAGATQQLRNKATTGGNLCQRAR
jgi:xanthine dehydrogenase YagS FAD-binding subunit